MKYNVELLKGGIASELKKLDMIEKEFAEIEEPLKLSSKDVSNYDRGAIGYILHNFGKPLFNRYLFITSVSPSPIGTMHDSTLSSP